jgi:hypothetical protein
LGGEGGRAQADGAEGADARRGEADSLEGGKSRNRFLSPLRTF